MEQLPQDEPRELKLLLGAQLDDDMLQFDGSAVRRFALLQSGDVRYQDVNYGLDQYVVKAPVLEPLLVEEYENLGEARQAIAPDEEPRRELFSQISDIDMSTYPEVAAWLATLPSPDVISIAAIEEAFVREIPSGMETLPCKNCRGAMTFPDLICQCTYGGLTFIDAEEEVSESQREKGVPDEHCPCCHGSGSYESVCPQCEGLGGELKYPVVELINDETGNSVQITLDIVKLLAFGDVHVQTNAEKMVFRDSVYFKRDTRLMLWDYLGSKFLELGIDARNALRVYSNDEGQYLLDYSMHDMTVETYRYELANGAMSHSFSETPRTRAQERGEQETSLLEEAQNVLSRAFYTKASLEGATPEQAIPYELRLRPLRPLYERFNVLKNLVQAKGYTLGFKMGFIATEEYGPSFLLLDQSGGQVDVLSCDYTSEAAIENALIRLEMV